MTAASTAGRVGVFGSSGSGKSTYVKRIVSKLDRVIVFDTEEEYGEICGVTLRSVDAVRAHMAKNWAKGFKIAYVPQAGKEARCLSSLSKLLLVAQQPFKDTGKGKGVTLVVEEMNKSFPVHGGETKCVGFADICSRGRKYGITVYGLTQRISEVSTRFRGNCDETVVLRATGKRDTLVSAETIGVDQSVIRSLKNLEYIREKGGKIERGKIKF